MSVREDQTLGQLVASASQDLTALVRGEIQLAKTELKDNVITVARGSAMFAAAAVIALVAVPLLPITLAYGLVALGLPPWLAFLITAVVFFAVAGLVALLGVQRFKKIQSPARTIASIEETKAMFTGTPPQHEE